MNDDRNIKIMKNGPYMVYGNIPLDEISVKIDALGKPIGWTNDKKYSTDEIYALCRCGKSKSMPFCDGSHAAVHFDGKETAGNEPYDKTSKITNGCENVQLMEKPILCTGAGFCHAGKKIEESIKKEKYLGDARNQCDNCPGGSLTLIIKGEKQEPEFNMEISVTNDVHSIGPIWVKGKVPVISADGDKYEIRNRVALCRCGKSSNMPFCDSSHLSH
jgi:CDGSH-type Zn-finger protein